MYTAALDGLMNNLIDTLPYYLKMWSGGSWDRGDPTTHNLQIDSLWRTQIYCCVDRGGRGHLRNFPWCLRQIDNRFISIVYSPLGYR